MRGEEAAAALEFVEGESSDEFDESADELGEYLDDQHFGFGKKLWIMPREADTIPIREIHVSLVAVQASSVAYSKEMQSFEVSSTPAC